MREQEVERERECERILHYFDYLTMTQVKFDKGRKLNK